MSETPRFPLEAGAAAHVVVDSFQELQAADSALALTTDVAHHLGRVLRLRDGDVVTITDGKGNWRSTYWRNGHVEASDEIRHCPQTSRAGVAFALTKNDKPELVVQKLTEIGIARIIPFVSERSIVKWDADKATRNVARWRTVAREAVQQSRQAWLPEISEVLQLDDLVALGAIRADMPTSDDISGPVRLSSSSIIAVGPEGGWTVTERSKLRRAVSLGRTVLRAETAAIVAAVALTSGIADGADQS